MNPTTADSPDQLRAEIQCLRDQISVLTKSTESASQPVAPVAVSDDRFRIMWESAVDAMALSDADGIVLDANQAYYDLYGYQPEQVINQSFAIIFLPEQRAQAIEQYRELIRTRTVYPAYETRIQRANGEQRVVESRASFVTSNDGQITLLSIIRDITNQKQAEAALHASEERFRAIIENGAEGIILLDANFQTRYVSPTVTTLLGYSPEIFAMLQMYNLCHQDDIPRLNGYIAALNACAGATGQITARMQHQDGSWRWMEQRGANQLHNPAINAIIVNFHDVTERVLAEQALHRALERLQVLADASHAFATAGPDYQAVLDLIAHIAAEKLHATCIHRLLADDGQWLDAVTIYDQNPAVHEHVQAAFASVRVHRDEPNPTAVVVRSGQPLLLPVIDLEAMRATLSPKLWPVFKRFRPHSLMIAPLRLREHVIGCIAFLRHEPGQPAFTDDDLRLAQDLADRAALAIGNARLYQDVQAAQQATAAALAQLNAIITNSPNGIGYLDHDLRYVLINPALAAINRQAPEAHIGHTLAEVLPITVLWLEPLMRQVLATGEIVHDLNVSGPPSPQDGSMRDWLINLYPVPSPKGEIAGVGVNLTDLTERRRAEAALHQSEARFAKAFHSSPVGLAINRIADGWFLDVNESFLHLIGYSQTEVIGVNWRNLDIFTDWDAVREIALQVCTTAKAHNQQVVLRTKQGDLRTILFSAEPLVLDGHECFISTCIDITERVRAQNVVRRTAERLATLHAVDQAILKLHAPTTIANTVITNIRALIPCQYASVMVYDTASAHGQLLTVRSDLPMSQPIGVPFLLPFDDFPAAFRQGVPWVEQDVQLLAQAEHTPPLVVGIASKQIRALLSIPLMVEWELIGTLNLAATAPAVFTAEHVTIAQEIGDTLSIALHNARLVESLQQELAARIRAEVALTAEHTQVIRLKNEFMATMSHELRTPLAAVLGQAELLSAGIYGSLNEKQTIAIQSIDQSGQHLLALINDILDYTRFEAGHLKLELQDVAVADLCLASLHMIKQTTRTKQIALTLTIDANVTIIQADVRRLKQILVNLLSNAVKFTPKDGKVGLEVSGDVAHEQVMFTVWDTGIGIAADDLPHLFQPFTQVDSSLSRQYEGTGLGLALVQRLAEAHGGSVLVTSIVGKGSRFGVTLPWQPSLQDVSEPTLSLPTIHSIPDRSERSRMLPLILLVDDRESTILLLQSALPSYGYQLHVARDGTEALAFVRKTRPALILMDIQLPGMSGIMVIQQIRDDPQVRQIPIIALTALVLPGDRERCLDAGADDYLPKPVSIHILIERIAAQLARG